MTHIIGLTGGIASGKSTVSQMLRELGVPVIDADEEARLAVEKGEKAYHEIVDYFGSDILLPDGAINRPKLGSIVFSNEEKRLKLNSIVHPAVRERMLQKRDYYLKKGYRMIVMDIPLLFESKLTYMVDKVIVVYVDEATQLERLMNRNGFTKEEAQNRISSQLPLKDKRELADAVIDNNGTIAETKAQLLAVLSNWGFNQQGIFA